MKNVIWSDQLGHRSRRAWLLLMTPDGVINEFTGVNIPGIVAVQGTDYEKAGKWSHTTYRLAIADGVRYIAGHTGWETGTFTEGLASATGRKYCDTWIDVANALQVTVAEAQRFLQQRPEAAKRLDAAEAAVAAIDDVCGEEGGETIAISFGSPTRRMMAEGFWDWPVKIFLAGQEVARVTPDRKGDWANTPTTGPVKILAAEKSSGPRGGSISLRLAVPAGATARHEE